MPSSHVARESLPEQAASAALPRLLWAWRWRALIGLLALGGVVWLAIPVVLGPVVAAPAVRRGALVQSVAATGTVQAPYRANIAARITGAVARVPVDEGQHVTAGQVLVELEDTELRAIAAQAESALALAETKLAQMTETTLPVLRENLAQAEATLVNAQQQYERSLSLSTSGAGTLTQRDADRRVLDVARAQERAARYQVTGSSPGGTDYAIAEHNVAQAKAALAIARARLDYARIAAPAGGTLIARNVEPGWVVAPNQTLMVLSPDGPAQLVVQVDEKNLGRLALGQRALASADAYPERNFPARVAYINPGVDPQRASVEVKLLVADPPDYLRQDMTVSVDIALAERDNTLVLPQGAVRDAATAHPFVLRVEDGRARRRDVTLGLRGAQLVEILGGLAEGDRVVPAAAAVADGGRVRVSGP
jgi:HlyD family secretion protein